ncbi:hypothetical protein ACROYT_G009460 [Oculina patagonica]
MSKVLVCCLILLCLGFQYVHCQLSSARGRHGRVSGKRRFDSGLYYKDVAGHEEARRANYLTGDRIQERESDDVPAAGRFRDDYMY